MRVTVRPGMSRSIRTRYVAVASPSVFGSVAMIEHGKELYFNNCMVCHGDSVQSGGIVTDLRWAQSTAAKDTFAEVVTGGKYATAGMAPFPDLSVDDVESVRAYIINRANEDAKAAAAAPAPAPN